VGKGGDSGWGGGGGYTTILIKGQKYPKIVGQWGGKFVTGGKKYVPEPRKRKVFEKTQDHCLGNQGRKENWVGIL